MLAVSYKSVLVLISLIWAAVRCAVNIKKGRADIRREFMLLLVYICIIVVLRFTFFPFTKIDGHIQPLIFDAARMWPFRINLVPFVNLMDYPVFNEAILNIVGNTTMFIPIGIVWPAVFRRLDTHTKTIGAGVLTSLSIEVLQLPFYDRVSDIDDLILNSTGYIIGYLIYLLDVHLKGRIRGGTSADL